MRAGQQSPENHDMTIRKKRGLLAIGAAALVLGGVADGDRVASTVGDLIPAAQAAPAAAAAPPPASFARCAVCHNTAKGAPNKLGPNLYGTYGHKMGQTSFAFSDAVKKSNLTLDDKTLDKWLENPRALVPGNRMSFPGLKEPTKRKEIIDYLKKQR
jgi:cytochrome c